MLFDEYIITVKFKHVNVHKKGFRTDLGFRTLGRPVNLPWHLLTGEDYCAVHVHMIPMHIASIKCDFV